MSAQSPDLPPPFRPAIILSDTCRRRQGHVDSSHSRRQRSHVAPLHQRLYPFSRLVHGRDNLLKAHRQSCALFCRFELMPLPHLGHSKRRQSCDRHHERECVAYSADVESRVRCHRRSFLRSAKRVPTADGDQYNYMNPMHGFDINQAISLANVSLIYLE